MHAATSVRATRTPQPRWRLALLITVLAGFFLMHGLSGADTCASATPSLSAGAGSTVATAATSPMAGQATTELQTAPATSPADQCCAAMGTLCVPLRPQDTGWLLTLLLLGLAAFAGSPAWTRLIAAALRLVRAARPRPATGPPVHLLACVIRT